MAQTIKLKRSATTGNAPTTSQLALGELGINTTDGKLFLKKSVSGTESIVEVGGLPLSGGTLTGNLSLGDNVKAQFGASNDLQIFHDGSHSYITDTGTGDLRLNGASNVDIRSTTGVKMFRGVSGGEAILYHNNNEKLATTSTGIDVTGTVETDELTVSVGGVAQLGNIVRIGNNSAYADLTLNSADNSSGTINFADASDSNVGRIQYNHVDNTMILRAADATRVLVSSTGIDVTGSVVADGLTVNAGTDKVVLANNFATTGNTDSPKLAFYSFGDVATYPVSGPSIKKVNTGSYGAGDLVIYQHGPYDFTHEVEALRISSSANVNIPNGGLMVGATTAPSAKLDVTGTIKSASGTQSSLYLSNAARTNGFLIGRSLSSNDAQDLFIYDTIAASTRLSIASSGSVGIGTSSPSYKLHISGGILGLTDGVSSATHALVGGNYYIQNAEAYSTIFQTNGAERMRIDSSGNVGIGTSSPYGLTHWKDSSTVNLVATNSGADGQANTTVMSLIGQARGYSNNLAKLASIDFKTDPTTWYYGAITFNVANLDGTDISRTPLEAMRIDRLGNVGIGTSSASSFTGAAAQNLVVGSGSGHAGMTVYSGTTSVGGLAFADGTAAGSHYRGLVQYRHSEDAMLLYTGEAERMRIDSSGSVGIGTSTVNISGFSKALTIDSSESGIELSSSGTIQALFAANTQGATVHGVGSSGIRMFTSASGSTTERFRINSDGSCRWTPDGTTHDMTLTAGGDLLVGKTASSFTTAGAEVQPSGRIELTRSGELMNLNRLGSDGNLIRFFGSSALVGSIGAFNARMYFAGPNASTGGFRIDSTGSNGVIVPTTTTGANRDAATDLGYSSGGTNIRFRDLYLSGTVNATQFDITAGTDAKIYTSNAISEVGSGIFAIQSVNSAGSALKPLGFRAEDIRFATGSAERTRIASNGTLYHGKTADSLNTGGLQTLISGQTSITQSYTEPLRLNRMSTEGAIQKFYYNGAEVGSVGTNSGLFISSTYGTDSGIRFASSIIAPSTTTGANRDAAIDLGYSSSRFKDLYLSGKIYGSTLGIGDAGIQADQYNNAVKPFRPDITSGTSDNYLDLGTSSVRWVDIYATNGTIQTSDRNEKQDIESLTEAEERVAIAAKGLLKKFRWKSAVEDKGDDARIHFGIIAQDLQDAFEAEGLDAGRYGMFTSNTWTNEDGEEQTRMGVRYSELLAFIISAI